MHCEKIVLVSPDAESKILKAWLQPGKHSSQQMQASLEPKYAPVMIVLSVLLTGIPLITFLDCSLTISFWSPFQTCWASKPQEATTLSNSIILM